MADNSIDPTKLVLSNMKNVADIFSGARNVLTEFQSAVKQLEDTDNMRRSSTAITVTNRHQYLQLIDGAYVTATGLCEPPAELFINTDETGRWVFNSSTCVIYEVRDLNNGLGSSVEPTQAISRAPTGCTEKRVPFNSNERVFIVAGAWSGRWKRNRMMLGVIRTTENFSIITDPGRLAAYQAVKARFVSPGARLRIGARLGNEGFSVTAQMNENSPARMRVVLEHWDCCDTENDVLLAVQAGDNVTFERYTPPSSFTAPLVRPRHYVPGDDEEEEEGEEENGEEEAEQQLEEGARAEAEAEAPEPEFKDIGEAVETILYVAAGQGGKKTAEDNTGPTEE
ncbi:hypothetical protein BDF22DRAFT_672944 [Syncephalis plumigaleata]|nr:hypothetical protein BDF22DRAFT_672944 [Syncephalis plumigaleata]